MNNKNLDNHLLTKKQLLLWLNDLLKIEVNCIEELSSGAAFCQLVDIISRGAVRMQKINWNAKLQHQNLANIKILSTGMLAAGIDKKFDVVRISQKKTQDILELLQWFRKYFIQNHLSIESYDPISRRKSQSIEKNLVQVRSSLQNKKQRPIAFHKPQLSAKKQPENIITDTQLKNCLRVNKAIQKIITQEPSTPAETKLELIKRIIFKKNQGANTHETIQNHQVFNQTISSSSNVKTIPDRDKANIDSQNVVKIQTCPFYNPHLTHEYQSHDSFTSQTKKSQPFQEMDTKEHQASMQNEKRIPKSEKGGRN